MRLGVFLGIFAIIAAWELAAPRRVLRASKGLRWTHNLTLTVLNVVLVRAALPVAAIGVAVLAAERGMGLFNLFAVPHLLVIPLSVLALDLAIYLQHLMFHAVPLFWRLHRVHHADLDFDVTTGSRFHPIEIGLSILIRVAVILALGPPAVAVLIFEILLNASSMFNHGNVHIPAAIDRVLRWVVVTPDMHRVHHSIDSRETNSNFGFSLPWWDRLFGTYRAQPRAGHEAMTIGIAQFRSPGELRLDRMLLQPFRSEDVPNPSVGGTR
ncbi:MAG TPA: sterol desaturase family protein [Burkholderiales bacterium]|nr:sterol desaturase family protein [Burkholderiales bacterium]